MKSAGPTNITVLYLFRTQSRFECARQCGCQRPRPHSQQHRRSALGDPVKKNKFFNSTAFETWSTTEFTQQVLKTEPTALQRTGNFSQTLNTKGALSTESDDPWTTVLNVANNTSTRTPFPGNIIRPAASTPLPRG